MMLLKFQTIYLTVISTFNAFLILFIMISGQMHDIVLVSNRVLFELRCSLVPRIRSVTGDTSNDIRLQGPVMWEVSP